MPIADPKERRAPAIPPPGQRLRLIIDSDAKNEVDDQWAIALALLSAGAFRDRGLDRREF